MKILFTFPGQGAQQVGMLQQLPADTAVLDDAAAVLGDEIRQLDSPQALRHTRAVQLCLLITGVAWARALMARGVMPDMVSGLSIGAFPAAVVAGVLRFDDALRLVALRGELMEQAYPQGYGLTAIMGLSQPEVEALLVGSGAYLANLNAERQIVIAGSDESMAQVAERALQRGASRAQRLRVSVPSHCALLEAPAGQLAAAMASLPLSPAKCGYLSGSSARAIWQPERIADDLALNMARTVRWHEAMVAAEERDVRLAIEMPPGGVLTCLAKQAFSRAEAFSLARSGIDVVTHRAAQLRAQG
ncbi:Malonyl CoA-acyl carrier protein transacylase [Dickeya dianthicola]|uniref:Malonyl CoA-acyl carrier protein transacylase n=6 Tax=Dickeya dianthicola TaxID=204039 RepID=A0AAP2G8V7_9GAMM|nr:malonate decarboxylase subunit epsilon [Dickeya dianthicola]ATO32522.1 Malonyl CoA acyl carrier protein transacylase [Dickeya dianthicola RNS04.9]AYC18532.1 Malonyl CoA-acyl carrier protein transacylase [Dickeya dianthicola]MBI0439189.1 malonate decarboxylase subunit epsilon [Dickeya dianthicola]MBI0462943.1 malonate decarboxylase subunit epsilon [Dickeya dianthicola]MBI0479836.1 malonate decarboxylase subunit epsilon [Dickeya dianthicola]